MTIVCFGKKRSSQLPKLSVSCWHSIWKLNFIQVRTFSRQEGARDCRWWLSLIGLLKVQTLHPGGHDSLFSGLWCSWPEKALNLFLSDIHFQYLWFIFSYLLVVQWVLICRCSSAFFLYLSPQARKVEPPHDISVCLWELRVSGQLRGKSGGPDPSGTVQQW